MTILKHFGRFTFNAYTITRVGGIGGGLHFGRYEWTLFVTVPFFSAALFYRVR